MPSVGMRRSTRVFGTRVLRSGRRLSTEPREGSKHLRENKFQEPLDNSADGGGHVDDCHKELWLGDESSASVHMTAEPTIEERQPDSVVDETKSDRMFGIVYKRKRKRAECMITGHREDKHYAKKYVRKQWRMQSRAVESFGTHGGIRVSVRTRELALVVNQPSYDCYYWSSCFLTSLLSYMTRARIGMRHLSSFLLSKPIFDVYSSHGLLFLQDPVIVNKLCVCIFSGSGSVMASFSVNIYAIPRLFLYIQTSICLRSAHLDCLLVGDSENDEKVINVAEDAADQQDCISDISYITDNDTSGGKQLGQSAVAAGLPKSKLRNLQLRNSRNIQKRRSSLRSKRGRPPSVFRVQKAKGALASELFRISHVGAQFSAASPSRLIRSPDKRRSTTNIKRLKSTMAVATQDICTSSCSANLLITDIDKCYRVKGATISIESSASKQWFLTVTKGGTKKCSLIAQNVLRPSSCNRFTHAVIWSGDGNLKLEFTDKQDWFIFKELYKECSDRNMHSPSASVIPVPFVQEVSNPVDHYIPFVRPESYITFKDDELIRALMKRSANYDMDSDDDEWLAKLNNELNVGRELQGFITPENFELVIDALEKGVHCNPDEHLDEQAAYDICMHLESKEVIEAVYYYWVRKRKQKRSALIKVFQLYQPRRSHVIPKSVLRKKRSFKRQASQVGRGKQQPLLKAIAAKRDANAAADKKTKCSDKYESVATENKLHEANAAADKYESVATEKRVRAQMLMENADLATYKAMMALRIADAAAAAASFLL